MSYNKHTWQNGELITAEKLDNIECGLDCLANCSCIWENENPLNDFAAQEITLDSLLYRRLEIYLIIEDNNAMQGITATLNKDRAYQDGNAWHLPIKYDNYERFITVTETAVTFSDCKYGVKYNDKLVPTSIHAFE